jgi:hypothetical protein
VSGKRASARGPWREAEGSPHPLVGSWAFRPAASGRPSRISGGLEQAAYIVLGAALAVVGSVMSNDLAARRALVRETRTTIYRDLLPRLYAGDNPSWNTPPRPRHVSPNARVPVGELEVLQGVLPRADRRYGERLRILLDDAEETAREPERRQDELDRRTASFIAVADEFAAYLAERLRGPWWR